MTTAQIILGVLAAASVLYTIWGFPRMYGALTARSRLYRMVAVVLLDLLLILSLIGISTDFHVGVSYNVGVIRYVSFWSACLVLGLSLPLVAALDALESFVAVRRERRNFLHGMVAEERARLLEFAKEQEARIASAKARPDTVPPTSS